MTSAAHGFRYFFRTQLINSSVDSLLGEILMGHTVKQDDRYYSVNYRESQQMISNEYLKAVNNLTVDPKNRLERKVAELGMQVAASKDRTQARLDDMEKKVEEMLKQQKEILDSVKGNLLLFC